VAGVDGEKASDVWVKYKFSVIPQRLVARRLALM
jgi:hypothetical protein